MPVLIQILSLKKTYGMENTRLLLLLVGWESSVNKWFYIGQTLMQYFNVLSIHIIKSISILNGHIVIFLCLMCEMIIMS